MRKVLQRTLHHSIRCHGIGLHSGRIVSLVLRPANENFGIVFRRVDLPNKPEIPALAKSVVDTRMCTTIGSNDDDNIRIATVEHLLSALAGLGIDNIIIEVDGPEIPVMDGSAAPFVFLIQSAGIREQKSPKRFLRILKKMELSDGDKRCSLYPASGFRVSYRLHYPHPLLNDHSVAIDFSRQAYVREVCRARTFGFLHEVESLQKAGLGLGGSLDNAVIFDNYRVLNEDGLRYHDECIRHKILDTVGDLFLAGYPMVGAFTGELTGHAMNHALVTALLADETAWQLEECGQDTANIGAASFTAAMIMNT
ncbi:MAG: UDP-3-O-acyl-N-acetylglucosamine deacetylase [Mariprofundales bacterium]